MSIIFYTNYSDDDVVNKNLVPMRYGTNNIVPCRLVYPCSMDRPIAEFGTHLDRNTINYFYLENFNAYYKIVDLTILPNGITRITGEIDALMTARNYILAKRCLVDRYEFVNEISQNYGLLPDNEIVSRIDRTIQQKKIGDVGGNATGTHICLTTTGGLSNANQNI